MSALGVVSLLGAACPDCDVGRVARYQFFTESFSLYLAVALAPFLIILCAAVCAEHAEPFASASEKDSERSDD